MKRGDTLPRPTAGCLSVPLFNQRKRSRLPLTSNPTENDFSAVDLYDQSNFLDSPSQSVSGTSTQNQSHKPSAAPFGLTPRGPWNRPFNHQSSQPTGQPTRLPRETALQGYVSASQAEKPPNHWSQQPRMPGSRQEVTAPGKHGPSGYLYGRGSTASTGQHGTAPSRPKLMSYPQPGNQRTVHGAICGPTMQMRASGSGPRFPVAREHQKPQKAAAQWQFKPSPMPCQPKNTDTNFYCMQPTTPQENTPVIQMRTENQRSLRILTVVIETMRHWSQFKSKTLLLFELFATLDSAVTDGKYSAKHFLMRTGRDVVSCIYFENDKELPKLFRGLVHRCMGNYDRESNTFTCVSVRLATRHEQQNAQEAIRASDEEMQQLVPALSEM